MVVLFFISALSIHSFFVHNNPFYVFLEPENQGNVDVLPVQNDYDKKNVKVKTISNQKNDESLDIDMNEEINSDFSENSLEGVVVDSELGDDYEEIIFQDNFDKEYREGTEDNYLGE